MYLEEVLTYSYTRTHISVCSAIRLFQKRIQLVSELSGQLANRGLIPIRSPKTPEAEFTKPPEGREMLHTDQFSSKTRQSKTPYAAHCAY